ncbi:hypothetical protein DPEC_G00318360 [Dallia pectoralis]|uniref:Uncharacterized protein n=1 Tax=Dallia pectoralis TaxID=75939 RepID=A0ACC2F9B3_DALPE|nr:hypothetical protein DPEC_G00318360 [Dallia pectoralis]
MLFSRSVLRQWFLAVFLLCSPVPHDGRPVDALTSRMRRSVTHAQLMHDKGRVLQDFKRRMWLQELLEEVHTAEIREMPVRPAISSGAGLGVQGVGVPVLGVPGVGVPVLGVPALGVSQGLGTPNPHPKPPGGTKNLPITYRMEEEEGTNLPQETNKSQTYGKDSTLKEGGKSGAGRKKKGRNGKRREGEKRKRRERSLRWVQKKEEPGSGYHLEWKRPFFCLH